MREADLKHDCSTLANSINYLFSLFVSGLVNSFFFFSFFASCFSTTVSLFEAPGCESAGVPHLVAHRLHQHRTHHLFSKVTYINNSLAFMCALAVAIIGKQSCVEYKEPPWEWASCPCPLHTQLIMLPSFLC